MAQVDPPLNAAQWVDEKGYLTRFGYQFFRDLWTRTGGSTDLIEQTVIINGGVSPLSPGKQNHTPTLESIGFLGSSANKMLYTTGSEVWAEATVTAFARSILDDADEATFKATVNLEIGTDVQAYDATLQSLSSLGTVADRIAYTTGVDTWAETPLTSFGRSILDDADEATFKATVNLEIGVDVQAYSANLDEAGTFFGSTDLSAAEAETLSDGSNADSLHVHSTTGLSDVTSGTYTPTLSNDTNLDASTAYALQYMRVGSVVTVSGRVDIDPTATGTIELGISLPISSTFSALQNCGGAGVARGVAEYFDLEADAANNRARMRGIAASTSSHTVGFSFTYLIA